MSMFENYGNNSYTAYNITEPTISKTVSLQFSSPFLIYDKYSNPTTILWDPKDSFQLKILFGKHIRIYPEDIVFYSSGQKPSPYTEGKKGYHAYNVIDGKCWLCKGNFYEEYTKNDWIPIQFQQQNLDPEWEIMLSKSFSSENKNIQDQYKNIYIWEEKKSIEFPSNGEKDILINPYSENSRFVADIMNFRHEVIYSFEFETSKLSIDIDLKTMPLLLEGQYFLNMYVVEGSLIQQQSQIDIMIIENPSKYINQKEETYEFQYTTQIIDNQSYVWKPIGNFNPENDYIWIPINS